MSESEQRVIARKILAALYDDWENNTGSSLHPVQEEGQWEDSKFYGVIQKLKDKYGFIVTAGNTIDITPAGVLHAEESGIISEDKVELHKKIRSHILAYLTNFYESEGSLADEHYEKIAEGASVDPIEMLTDLSLLTDLGYVESTSSSSFKITDEGLQFYRGADYEDII